MDMKLNQLEKRGCVLDCKNTFRNLTTEEEKSRSFTEKWIKVAIECEKRKLYN